MKTITWIVALFRVKPVIIDGAICVAIAMLSFSESSLGKDEAYKYFNAYVLYYLREIEGCALAGLVALNFFRSKSYSDHVAKEKAKQALLDGSSTVTTQTTEIKTNETQISPTPSVTPNP